MFNKLLTISLMILFVGSCMCSKRGLGWPWNGVAQDFHLFQNSKHVSWVYNWENWRPQGLPGRFEFVAMQRTAQGIQNLRSAMQNNHAKILLGFNEPDIASQANMSPEHAAHLWQQFIKPIGKDLHVRLGSPAISNGNNGIPWLKSFMQRCGDCQVSFIACHWYGPNFNHFKQHIEAVHRAFPNKKIWVTEFALQGNPSGHEQEFFFKQASAYLESLPYVERYAWFGAFRTHGGNALVADNGSLTSLGRAYN